MLSNAHSSIAGPLWKNRDVLVTGATGLLGSWIVRTLVEAGANVSILVRESADGAALDEPGMSSHVRVLNGCVEDADRLRVALGRRRFSVIFHAAAQAVVAAAEREPARTLETNVRGTWNILEHARTAGADAVVVTSTSKVYAHANGAAAESQSSRYGGSVYGVSKACVDLITAMYAGNGQVPAAIARFTNVFGGGDRHESRLIPGAICSTLAGKRFVLRGHPDAARDFLYVRDAVTAELCLAEGLLSDNRLAGEAFNFGASETRTTIEVVRTVLRIAGREDLQPVLNPDSPEATRDEIDCARARRVLGWRPEFSFERAISETFDWYRLNASANPAFSSIPQDGSALSCQGDLT